MKALTVNRVGDMFLSVGFFAIFWVFGNVDYATVFSVAPFINESAITIIGLLLLVGAMAKSRQIGLHTWLPDRMEGRQKVYLNILVAVVCLIYFAILTDLNSQSLLPQTLSSLLFSTPKSSLNVITGNMLGDGNIRYSNMTRNKGVAKGNARYRMTMKTDRYNYLKWLYDNVYRPFTTNVGLIPYPNPNNPKNRGLLVTPAKNSFCR